MLLPHGTIVALIDGQTFDLYRNSGNEAAPALTPIAAPRLDSQNHSAASHHSHPGNHARPQVQEDSHASAAAQYLNQQVLAHKIDDLVIVAPPRTLGELRKHYHRQTEAVLRREINHDYCGRSPDEILAALREPR